MHEKFKIIPEFPAYRVSNFGRIQSRWCRIYDSKSQIGDCWNDISGRNSGPPGKQYMSVCLCAGNGKPPISKRIHKLIADAFLCKKPPGRFCVRHLDGNKFNNRADNLAFGTYKENEDDKRRHGTWYGRISNATLCAESVRSIRKLAKSGAKQTSIAAVFGVSRPTITRVVNRTIWKHIN